MDIPNIVSKVVEAGNLAPSADNSQPWIFVWNGKSLALKLDRKKLSGNVLDASSSATWLAIGAVAENMISVAKALNASVSWSAINTDIHANETLIGEFDLSEAGIEDSNLVHPAFQRHTNRFPFKNSSIEGELLSRISSLSEGQASARIYTEKAELASFSSLVQAASRVRFRIREVHEWFSDTLRFSEEEVASGDGLDIRTLPLPPGGKALLKFTSDWNRMEKLNKAGLYKLFAAIEGQPVRKGPALLAITSPSDNESVFSAGRLMQRAWCQLNAAGVAVHPYYVISDQIDRYRSRSLPSTLMLEGQALEEQLSALIGSNKGELQMLMRIGYPARDPVRSRRLDIDKALQVV